MSKWQEYRTTTKHERLWRHKTRAISIVLRLEVLESAPLAVMRKNPKVTKEPTWNVIITTPLGSEVLPFDTRQDALDEVQRTKNELDTIFVKGGG